MKTFSYIYKVIRDVNYEANEPKNNRLFRK